MHIRDANGKTYPLERRMIVASAEDPEVVFAVPESRPGWCIVSRGNRFILTPLDPRAKIKVNGQNVQQRALKAGDEISVGEVSFTVSAARVQACEATQDNRSSVTRSSGMESLPTMLRRHVYRRSTR